MFRKILMPVDLTDRHQQALDIAGRFANEGTAEVTLLHVVEIIPGIWPEEEREFYDRIEQAARYVPVENLAISPQCGFASNALGNRLTPADQQRKLELVVKVAQRVWP